ncbi:MAG: DUF116 domain-containing protein [Candidatus Zixiibacteriota bacterium]|nr:MAG: DUF116 domain-containing protein [candidate division Zixibacteria bacterium]
MCDQAPTYKLGPDFDEKLRRFVRRFIAEGYTEFSKEFANLEQFIAAAEADKGKREDHDLRRTPKEMYLLEAVSFRIYDDLDQEGFNRARDTLIILPDCLRLHNPDCQMEDGDWGDICQECTPECQAYQVCELAQKYGAEVYFSKRALPDQLKHYADRSGDLGVVGVACLMMLAMGMRIARDLKVPVRGVPLNFTGCEHWNDQPFASAFDFDRLKAILEEKHGS